MSKYFKDKLYEIETKFLIKNENALSVLESLKNIAGLKLKSTKEVKIHDIYFETPDFYLIKEWYAYRFRKKDDQYHVAFKHKLGVSGDSTHVVEEVEEKISEDQINDLLKHKLNIKPFLQTKKIIDPEKLTEKIEVDNLRKIFVYCDDKDNCIELAFDNIVSKAKGVELKEKELEIEAQGIEKDIYNKFIEQIKTKIPGLEPTEHGKIERLIMHMGEKVKDMKYIQL